MSGWDRQLEGGLPDSRLSGHARARKTVFRYGMELEVVFCANCGKPSHGITPGFSPHIFFQCDDCDKIYGPPPNCLRVLT